MALTINWTNPATGAVSPTAAQASIVNLACVNVTTDGALTTGTFTHNMAIPAAQLALGFPIVTFEPETATTFGTLLLNMNPATGKTANTVVLTFAAVVAQFNMFIWRPYQMIE
jgi:hypothetical protein